jgi:glycerol-3-phosphate O-acyltransferase / dihydroxyacetone phosphate acyltransferase
VKTLKRWTGGAVRFVVRCFVRLYYPLIEITGRQWIPRSGPVLFVANHAASLIDPVMIGIAAGRPVHFFAKAPLFDLPLFGAAMQALGMIPAYRGVDGAADVKRNLRSLGLGAETLARGEAVGIFPEGKSHDLPRVEQVRTGAARVAVQALKEGAPGLLIVPLGLNYENKEQFRSSVWVRAGEPIEVAGFVAHQGGDERRAVRQLTLEIDRRLKEVVVHLQEEKWESFLNDLEVLRPPLAEANDCVAPLRQRKRIADAMNYFLATDRPRAEAVAGAIEEHRGQLAAAGLELRSPLLRLSGAKLLMRMLRDFVWMAVWFLPAFLGTAHHLVPFIVVRAIARPVTSGFRSTVSLARLGIGLPIYGLWYGLVWWWQAQMLTPWFATGWCLAMPFAGVLALNYWRRGRETARLWSNEFHVLFRSANLQALRSEQVELRAKLGGLAEEYARVNPPVPSFP